MGVWFLQTSCQNPSEQPSSPSPHQAGLPGHPSLLHRPRSWKGRGLLLGPGPPALRGEPSQEGEAARGLRSPERHGHSPKSASLRPADRPLKPPPPTAKLRGNKPQAAVPLPKGFSLTFSVPPAGLLGAAPSPISLQAALRGNTVLRAPTPWRWVSRWPQLCAPRLLPHPLSLESTWT